MRWGSLVVGAESFDRVPQHFVVGLGLGGVGYGVVSGTAGQAELRSSGNGPSVAPVGSWTITEIWAWGSAGVPGLAPGIRRLQYGSVGSSEPWGESPVTVGVPVGALQLNPLPGVVPEQVKVSLALGCESDA